MSVERHSLVYPGQGRAPWVIRLEKVEWPKHGAVSVTVEFDETMKVTDIVAMASHLSEVVRSAFLAPYNHVEQTTE